MVESGEKINIWTIIILNHISTFKTTMEVKWPHHKMRSPLVM